LGLAPEQKGDQSYNCNEQCNCRTDPLFLEEHMRKICFYLILAIIVSCGTGILIFDPASAETHAVQSSLVSPDQDGPGENQTRAVAYAESSVGLDWPQWEGGRSEIEMADVNLDGNIDLITIGDHGSPLYDEKGLMVYFGNGSALWQGKPVDTFRPPLAAVAELLGDFDPCHQARNIDLNIGVDRKCGMAPGVIVELQSP